MIDINSLKGMNTFIATIPRTASTYLNQEIKYRFETLDGYDNNYGEFIYWNNEWQQKFINSYNKGDKFLLAKVMLDFEYEEWQRIHHLNFWEDCQLIILYPRKDALSHFTSLAMPMARNDYSDLQQYSKPIRDAGVSWWNISPGESTRESVIDQYKDMPKITNEQAVRYMDEMLDVVQLFRKHIDFIEASASIVHRTSYDEINESKNNKKETLIWVDPKEKLKYFDDPDFVINRLNSEIDRIGGWLTL
jgi:hypothetical protein